MQFQVLNTELSTDLEFRKEVGIREVSRYILWDAYQRSQRVRVTWHKGKNSGETHIQMREKQNTLLNKKHNILIGKKKNKEKRDIYESQGRCSLGQRND